MIIRVNRNSTAATQGVLRSNTTRVFGNETYPSLTWRGPLAAGDLLRIYGFSNTNPSLTSGAYGAQHRGQFSLKYVGPTPVATAA